MKKIFISLLIAGLLLTGCTTPKETNEGCANGTYEGVGKGYSGGESKATIVVEDNKITSVTLTDANATAGFGLDVIETFQKDVVARQTIGVDAISGSTETSNGLIEAMKNALDGKCDTSVFKEVAVDPNEVKDIETDVVIIGAGGAGLTAAIEATSLGKEVYVVEINGMPGGNTSKSTGGMNAAKTVVQDTNEFAENAGIEKTIAKAESDFPELKELTDVVKEQYAEYQENPTGYFDSVELFKLDTLVGGGNINNHDLVDVLVNNSKPTVEWLETIDVKLSAVGSFGGASVKRIHKPVNDEGKTIAIGGYLVTGLTEAAKKANVNFLFDTEATAITLENDVVNGITAVTNGETFNIKADSVVVATGGFSANSDMVVSYREDLKGFVTTNGDSIQGDGIAMVEAIGGALVDIEQIQIHPTVEINSSALITEGLRGDGAIMVNAEGVRFFDEVGTRNAVSAAIIEQTNSSAYLIVDQKMVDKSAVIAGYISKGFTVEGETYEELAKAMNVDEATFVETMNKWNSAVDAKNDPEFNRTSFAEKLDTGKYYAILVAPGVHHTMGGVKINTNTEVLNQNDEVIPNLYAAGEVTGGVHGNNRLGGNAVSDVVIFGRIAGSNAANNSK